MHFTYASRLKRHLEGENSLLRSSAARRSVQVYCHGNRSEQSLVAIVHDLLWDFGQVTTEEGVGLTIDHFSLLVVGNALIVKQGDRLILQAHYDSKTQTMDVESSNLNPLELQSFRKTVAQWLEVNKLKARLQPSLSWQGVPNAYIVAQQAALQSFPRPQKAEIAPGSRQKFKLSAADRHRSGKAHGLARLSWASLLVAIAIGYILHPSTQEVLATTLNHLSVSLPLSIPSGTQSPRVTTPKP